MEEVSGLVQSGRSKWFVARASHEEVHDCFLKPTERRLSILRYKKCSALCSDGTYFMKGYSPHERNSDNGVSKRKYNTGETDKHTRTMQESNVQQ